MVSATELRIVLDVLKDCDLLKEEPEYDVFVDIMDVINKNLHEKLKEKDSLGDLSCLI